MVNKAEIGRFDGDYKNVAFNDGDTVGSLLSKAGLKVGDGEGIQTDDGTDVPITSKAVNGETYNIVGNYKQANEGDDKVDVSTFNKEALSMAQKDIDEERLKHQAEKAKDVLRKILNRKDVVEYNIAEGQKELGTINKELKVFATEKVPRTPKG